MSADIARRLRMITGGCLVVFAAAVFALWFFGALVPPRNINRVLSASSPLPPGPLPELTQPPPASPTPLTSLIDNFAQPGNFPRGPGADYGANGFVLSPRKSSPFLAVPLKNFDSPADSLTLAVEAAPSGRSSPIEYGVFFWHSLYRGKADRFLAFTIDTEGRYRLQAIIPFTTATADNFGYRIDDLLPPTRTTAIKTDGSPNRLRVEIRPHHLSAFVNETPVLDRDNPDIDAYRNRSDFDGQVGLYAASAADGNAQVEFTQFELEVGSAP